MKCLKLLSAFAFLFLTHSSLFAQPSADNSNTVYAENTLTEITDENWSFYKDEENDLYFVDFEKIPFNLSDVVIKDQSGSVVFQDDVLDLPVNTIYEIDLSEFEIGAYSIELRSFTGFIRKEVSVR